MNLERVIPSKIEASDVVQQTLLEAHGARDRLPTNEDELCTWLRVALANNIRDERRRLRRQKRDAAREQSLEIALNNSNDRLAEQAATLQPSPSQQAIHAEQVLRLANAVWQLPDAQRDAVMLHHLQGWTISQSAQSLGKSEAAVAGLLHRGLRQLRTVLTSSR
jgi:RNA polymerase sigma-70 factor (ECF subfamily)